MLKTLLNSWFGDLSKEEIKKFFFLAGIFLFTIGVYWFLRTSKDGIFNALVGFDWQPVAKWVSMGFVIPLTLVYSALVDKFPRHKIFYALSFVYGLGAIIFAYLLSNPVYGLANATPEPTRILGWAYYLFVESFGSLMVVCFWTFAADTTSPESAKKGFSVIAFIAQFGALLGSMINAGYFGTFTVRDTLIGCGFAILMIAVMIFTFMKVIPQDQLKSYGKKEEEEPVKKKKKVGFLEGFRLVVSQPYLIGIFFSIMIFEIVATLFDFKFKTLIGAEVQKYIIENDIPVSEVGALKTQMFNTWVGKMGVFTAIIAIVSILLGIGNIGRKLGLTVSLTVLPILLAGVALVIGSSTSLWFAAAAVIIAKGINYALYQPSKEQLYIPTSRDAKYKSKAFIEMFGSRTSKAVGSLINMVKMYLPLIFPLISLFSSLILCAVWVMISLYLGRTHAKAVKNNEVVC